MSDFIKLPFYENLNNEVPYKIKDFDTSKYYKQIYDPFLSSIINQKDSDREKEIETILNESNFNKDFLLATNDDIGLNIQDDLDEIVDNYQYSDSTVRLKDRFKYPGIIEDPNVLNAFFPKKITYSNKNPFT